MANWNYDGYTPSTMLPTIAQEVLNSGTEMGSRQGDRTLELTQVAVSLAYPWRRYITTPGRNASLPAQIAETMWIMQGRNDIAFIKNYLPRAAEFSDDGYTWRGGYGPRLRQWKSSANGQPRRIDQLRYVYDALTADPTTRRAVMSIYDPAIDTEPGKDIPCNNWIHFLNRNGRLEMHIAVRSNDLFWGWSGVNVFEWSAIQEMLAGALGIEPGSMHFSIGSMHLYSRHWSRAARLRTEPMSATGGSPRFQLPESQHDSLDQLDTLVDTWMEIENRLRCDGGVPVREVLNFPEPMLRSWLQAIAWWHTSDDAYLVDLLGTDLHTALMASPGAVTRRVQLPTPVVHTQLSAPVVHTQLSAPVVHTQQMEESIEETKVMNDPFVNFVADLHAKKHAVYGDSWCRRGETIGILANIARKMDRLGKAGAGDTSADTAVDLLCYLLKYQLWLENLAPDQDKEPQLVRGLLQDGPETPCTASGAGVIIHLMENRFTTLEHAVSSGASDKEKYSIVVVMARRAQHLARYLWLIEQGNATRFWEGYDDDDE